MTSTRPSGRPSTDGGVPPTSRRSARQQRIASRESSRALARASTHGGGGGGLRSLAIFSGAAVLVAVVVIGAALLLTGGGGSATGADLPTPNAPQPSQMTLASVPMNGVTLGDPNAAHTIDVWEDFQCPHCRDFTLDIEPEIIQNYVANGDAKLVWHDWIVIDTLVGGTESRDAANAAQCANDQGKFWTYHDWLFTNQFSEASGAFSKARLKTIGQMIGMPDLSKFDSCVDSGTHNAEVTAEGAQHPSAATGTPTVVVDGTLLSGYDYATVSDALNTALGITPSPSVSASASASASATATPTVTPAASGSVAATESAAPSASPVASPSPSPSPTAAAS